MRLLITAFVVLFTTSLLAQDLPDPARFESAMERFEAMDRESMPPEDAIVLTGSSSIARWNDQAAEALAPLTVIPRGFGGSVMNDVLHYLDRVVLNYNPRAVLIYEGDNDTGRGEPIPTEVILVQLREIIDRIHAQRADTRVYVLAVKPSVARLDAWPLAQEVSAGYREIADADPRVHYVDVVTPFMQDDGTVMTDIFVADDLHFNDKGNRIWGETIREALMPHEAQYE
jgi:lysophospholipase L1-like esterase